MIYKSLNIYTIIKLLFHISGNRLSTMLPCKCRTSQQVVAALSAAAVAFANVDVVIVVDSFEANNILM